MGELNMAANQLVQARIDGATKAQASAVLAAIGLTVSDFVRIGLTRVAQEKAIPFALPVPNEATIAAITEAREGKLERVSIGELRATLREND